MVKNFDIPPTPITIAALFLKLVCSVRVICLTFTLLFLLPYPASAEAATRNWVRDWLHVPLRSGASPKHRIVHKGLRSGSEVIVLRRDEDSGYALVRTEGGTEGYIPIQYLVDEPIAELKLEQAQALIRKMQANKNPMQSQLTALEEDNTALRKQNEVLTAAKNAASEELERIKKLSANTVAIDHRNQQLLEQNRTLKNQIDELNAENGRLKDASGHEWFKLGAGAIILGLIMGILLPHFRPRRKQQSGWV